MEKLTKTATKIILHLVLFFAAGSVTMISFFSYHVPALGGYLTIYLYIYISTKMRFSQKQRGLALQVNDTKDEDRVTILTV